MKTRGRTATIAAAAVICGLITSSPASGSPVASRQRHAGLSHVRVSAHRLPSTGGRVTVTAHVANEASCQLQVRPAVAVRHRTHACRGASVRWRLRLPANRSDKSRAYRVAVIARAAHHRGRVVRLRSITVSRAVAPRLRALSVSTHELPSTGGPLTFTARLTQNRKCWLTSVPRMEGLPARRTCRGNGIRWNLTVPPNPTASPQQYKLTLHVAGSSRRVAAAQRTVNVAAQSPTCPEQTDSAVPTTRAFFNDPTTGQPADQDAVVNAMINLICHTSPPTNGVPASVNLAMFIDELPEVGDALLWAHQYRSANIRVILDGSNAEIVDSTGATAPNPAYQELVAGLPSGAVVLCGANAGTVPLPADGDVRRKVAADPVPVVEDGTACAGDNILHTKLLAISSVDTAGDSAIFTASQNLSSHSEQSAFNNGLQLIGSGALYRAVTSYFDQLASNTRNPNLGGTLGSTPSRTVVGTVTPEFFPRNTSGAFPSDNTYDATEDRQTDETADLLSHVSCSDPGAFAGDHSGGVARTIVRIAMYSFGARNLVTNRLVGLENAGCDVQLVYTRMSNATRSSLSDGGVTLMQLNDAAYPMPDGSTARIFVHDKYLLISGAYKDNGTVIRNQKIIQTGSQNLTQVGLHHNDDQVVQLRQTATRNATTTALYNAYASNWQHLVAVLHAT